MKQSSLSWIILITLSLVWGSSFILMKKGMLAFSSEEVAALRISIASLFMFPFLIKHYKIDFKKYLPGLLIMGVFGNLIPAFLFTKAETQISSSLAGMLNALTPFFTMIIGVWLLKQKVIAQQLLGIIIGFLGASSLVFLGDSDVSNSDLRYTIYVVLATLCYAISVNGIKYYLSDLNSITATVWSFTLIGPISLFYLITKTDFQNKISEHPEALHSLGFISILAIVGSALSVIVYNTLIKQAGTVFAASCTYLIPIVAIGWGVFDGENIQLIHLLSITVIIIGVWMINRRSKITKNELIKG
jgi:drug/metabolite transporter (DMT)-like permease